MASRERMTEQDFTQIERKLCDALGTEHGVVADVAYRGLIRVLAEVRELQRENASLRNGARNSYAPAQG